MFYVRELTVNGKTKKVAYCDETEFRIQVRNVAQHRAYKTRYLIKGNLSQAVMYFNGINCDHRHSKRLLMNDRKIA